MFFRDSLRAQYYLSALEKAISSFQSFDRTIPLARSFDILLNEFASEVGMQIDSIILPAIVHEIHEAKSTSKLKGSSSNERYRHFFIENKSFTKQARAVIYKYPFLFEVIDHVIKSLFSNLSTALARFKMDYSLIKKSFGISNSSVVEKIQLLGTSDRHCNCQSLLFSFSNGSKVIYKPVDLRPDELFYQFVKELKLPHPFDLQCLNVFPQKNYGWIKYIHPCPCKNLEQIENFYRRIGVLLAITDALNYTDGHCENLIASGEYPVLLDGETLFQNYNSSIVKYKSIFSTLLVERRDRRKRNLPYSALQVYQQERLELFFHTCAE